MSKLLLTLLSILLFSSSWAQINKGTKILSGSLSYFNLSQEPNDIPQYERSGIYLNAIAGVAIRTNFVLGIQGSYQFTSSVDDARNSNGYGAGIFARKYFLLTKKLYVFGQASINYGHSKQEGIYNLNSSNSYAYSNRTNTLSFTLSPAFSYALTERVQLEALLPSVFSVCHMNTLNRSFYPSGEVSDKYQSLSAGGGTDADYLSGTGLGISIFFRQ